MPPEVDTPRERPSHDDLAQAEASAVLPDGARLCLLGKRLALFDGGEALTGRWLSADVHLTFGGGPIWRKLELSDRRYSINASLAERCLQMVALARLRSAAKTSQRSLGATEAPLLAAAIDATLEADELFLFSGSVNVKLAGTSKALGAFREPSTLVVSDRRVLLLAVSRAGDVEVEALSPPLSFEGRKLFSSRRQLDLSETLARFHQAILMEGDDRVLEAARTAYATSTRTEEAEALVSTLALRGEARAQWLRWFFAVQGNPTAQCPPNLDASSVDPQALWAHWQFSDSHLSAVLSALPRGESFDALAVAWAERVWWTERARPGADRVSVDLAFVERLLSRGAFSRARHVADEALTALPRPLVQNVERPGAKGDESSRQRVVLLGLRLDASENADERLEWRLQLLKMQPLHLPHLSAIADSGGKLGERAREVWQCLSERVPAQSGEAIRRTRPLPADVIERRLRADLNIEDPKLPHKVSTWIAQEPRPDQALLKQYCERVTRADAPIVGIVDSAATLLGLGHVDIYVSRGDEDVGVRAFAAARPFILIGGRHLAPDTTYSMTTRELCFVVASELFHVRVGNVRVGVRDVFRGALHKGRAGLDLVVGVLPLFKALKLADRIGMATARVSLPHVGRAIEAGRQVLGDDAGEPHGLSPAAEKLLSAQRELQLWADRAGLLCAGSFGAAVRGIAATRHDTARAAREFERRSVLTVVEEQRTGEPEAFDHVLLRIANLSAFYVSYEYGILASALEA